MFKFAVVISALVAVALAAPLDDIAPLNEAMTVDDTTPVAEILLIDETTPVDEIMLSDETTPVDEFLLIDETTPVDEILLSDETTPVDEFLLIDETTPVDDTLLIDETTPVDDTLLIDETTPIPILWQSVEGPDSDGSYSWSYETGNGIMAEERGTPKVIGTGDDAKQAMVVEGQYSYTDKDGNLIELTYVADENGFRAVGAHLPTPPPMPPAISRALEWIAAQPKTTPTPPKTTTTTPTTPTEE